MADLDVGPVILTGRFVRLEPMAEDHAGGLAEIGVGQDFWDFMLYGRMQSEQDMLDWVRDILGRAARGTDLPFVVRHLASGRIAGAARYLNIAPGDRGLEIGGTWYGSDFQRTVVNTECKYLLLKHAFETLAAIRVQFKTDLRNVRSQAALSRIGAIKEGILRNHMILPDGRYRDSVYYSIIYAEWPEVKKRLEGMLAR